MDILDLSGGGEVMFSLEHHEISLHDDLKPNFAFVKNGERSVVFVPFVVELQLDKNIDNAHMGKIFRYNIEILKANPRRQFITSVLTNLDTMYLAQTTRDSKKPHYLSHKLSSEFKFMDKGLLYIQQMLKYPKQVGYDENFLFSIEIKNR